MAINNYVKLTLDGVDSYRFLDDTDTAARVGAVRDALTQRAQGLSVSSYRFMDAGIPVIGTFYKAKFQPLKVESIELTIGTVTLPLDVSKVCINGTVKV